MDVINKCYDEKTNQLRDYSNLDSFVCLICLNGEGQIAETGDPAGTGCSGVSPISGTGFGADRGTGVHFYTDEAGA